MRLLPRNRRPRREKTARIAITDAEISADLHYPARSPRSDARSARGPLIR